MAALVEYFTLRRTAARAAAEPDVLREDRAALLRRARQRGAAADALGSSGRPAEALALGVAALGLYRDALALGLPEGLAPADVLRARGVPSGPAERLAQTIRRADATPLPALDADLRPEHEVLLRALPDAWSLLGAHTGALLLSPRGVARRRALRASVTVLAVAACAAAGVRVATRDEPPTITASGTFVGGVTSFEPALAVDGLAHTEWLLPDARPGTLDLRYPHPRDVHGVLLRNGHNRQYHDRAVCGYVVELYRGGQLVATHNGHFTRIVPTGDAQEVAVSARGVDHVRVKITSYHGAGAALAEVVVH